MKTSSHSRSPLKKSVDPSLKPRKAPVQTRSEETVRAIREAALQMLLTKGGARSTTTEIAHRAGVSVGTLYQYFPNKAALLRSILCDHLEHVTKTVEETCRRQQGQSLEVMASALVEDFIKAKLHNGEAAVALYSVADTLDAKSLLQVMQDRTRKALVELLKSAPGIRFPQVEETAMTLYASMGGTMRAVLEAGAGKTLVANARVEMLRMTEGYLSRTSVATKRA